MMDCKKALAEVNGDFDKAIESLKKSGLAKAIKKGDRIAAEGLIFSKLSSSEAVLMELNCETDFVAKNEDFVKLGNQITDCIFTSKPASLEEVLGLKIGNETITDKINSLISVIGEKISLRRYERMVAKQNGLLTQYSHQDGKIVVLIEVAGDKVSEEVAKNIAMQVVAMSPTYVNKSDVPEAILAPEKKLFLEQMKDTKKPPEILEKIVAGKVDKFASEISLMQQNYVKDMSGKKKVSDYLKENDPNAKVIQFVRLAVGEGIEKRKDDFAEEVARMTK